MKKPKCKTKPCAWCHENRLYHTTMMLASVRVALSDLEFQLDELATLCPQRKERLKMTDVYPLDEEIQRLESDPKMIGLVFEVAIERLAKSQPLEAKRIREEFDSAKLNNSRIYLFGEVMGRLEAMGVKSFFS